MRRLDEVHIGRGRAPWGLLIFHVGFKKVFIKSLYRICPIFTATNSVLLIFSELLFRRIVPSRQPDALLRSASELGGWSGTWPG